MLQLPTTEVLDTTPRGLADALDILVQHLLERDRDLAHVLATARDSLRAIGCDRYAAHITHQSARRTFVRRHKGVRHAEHLAALEALLGGTPAGRAG